MVVHEGERGEPLVDSREAEYREMQRNYRVLEAVIDRVLALSYQASLSVGVAVASASEGVDIWVGVPLSRCNILTEVKLAELRKNFNVPPSVGLRLPNAADVVRYPLEGCMLIFTDMYQHGFRLPFHPWVQMMLAKLGYASGQYNPNFWILLHRVYIAWWLAGLREPTFEQFMFWLGTGQLPKGKREELFYWSQAFYSKVLEEQVVSRLW
ncbi:unnamed protein product [Prunus armeniaca]